MESGWKQENDKILWLSYAKCLETGETTKFWSKNVTDAGHQTTSGGLTEYEKCLETGETTKSLEKVKILLFFNLFNFESKKMKKKIQNKIGEKI